MMAAGPELRSSIFPSFSYGWTYDVFLSFRGKDTRYGFTGNLYKDLEAKGIHTFMDHEKLQAGEEITPALVKAIEESRIAIIVFSENYASSSFCLDELSTIFDCIHGKGRLVLPVFFGVEPFHLRYHVGTYGEALAKHEERFKASKENMERLERWKMALNKAANFSGHTFKLERKQYQYEIIGKIVELVSSKISRGPLEVADYPVGLESRVLEVKSLVEVGSDDVVHMVGIYGVGGAGKTTLAKAVYNSIADKFERSCFLENVRENSSKNGLVLLQKTLLGKLVGEKDLMLSSVNEGTPIIKQRLHRKKVLLILDDVDKLEQLRALAGRSDWFGVGSRVIITTRDTGLLASHGIERKYEANGLNEKEALELLSWKAFKNNKVDPSYEHILKRSVLYASRHPLALELIGSNLSGKSIEEWESAIDQYEAIPPRDIQKRLKVSFDALEENEQQIFLDIVCFFKGYELPEVELILRAHYGVCVKYHIRVLIDKCLMKIDHFSKKLTLHDLIEDMGKEIVRQESPQDAGKRSRLWLHEDIFQVLKQNKGSSKIQIIILNYTYFEEGVVHWDGKAFEKMENLKTLIIRNVHFYENPKHLPNSLRVLEWWGYPSQSLPVGFHPEKLTIFKLPNSCLVPRGLPNMHKTFKNMRELNYDNCKSITHIPNLSGLLNLEELSFRDCENLITIDKSVGFLDKLKILNAQGCSKLRSFPPIMLTSLEHLHLSYCSSLERFPEILGKMENITELLLERTPIKELPYSIYNLTQLGSLTISECGMVQLPSSIVMMPELKYVMIFGPPKQDQGDEKISLVVSTNVSHYLSYYNISDEFLSMVLTCFANGIQLDLSYQNFTFLPPSITFLHSLRKLNLYNCHYLREIRGIPSNLETLSATCCRSLIDLDLTVTDHPESLRRIILDQCKNLGEIRGIRPKMELLSASNCTSLTDSCRSMLLNQELHKEIGNMVFSLPGSRIPWWFEHHSNGQSISFWFRDMIPAMSLCVAIGLENDHSIPFYFCPKLKINGSIMNKQLIMHKEFVSCPGLEADHIFIFDKNYIKYKDVDEVLLENEWNHAEVYIDIYSTWGPTLVFMQTGLHVFKQENSMEDIQFTDPYERDDYRDSNSTTKVKVRYVGVR